MAGVVSDTSPIRALAFLGLMPVLGDIFGDVVIPPEVDRELRHPAAGSIVVDVGLHPFVQVRAPSSPERVRQFSAILDAGESEALALALEIGADLILIDESQGRAVALRNGLVPVGVLGILLKAKERGLVIQAGPLIERLQGELRFFISPRLKSEILRLAGEERS